jgi:hypothetical protein
MKIPTRGIDKFVKELVDTCTASQTDRIQRGATYKNFAMYGSEQPQGAATFNKMWSYLGDLKSLMYSPVSLRFNISDPDIPSVLSQAKGQSTATRMRNMYRESDTDSLISQAVWWSLVKGKSFVKGGFQDKGLTSTLVQPEAMGVMWESHDKLDKNMEAFTHSMLITPYQFERLVWNNPDREALVRQSKNYMREAKAAMGSGDSSAMQVIVGGLYPFQPAGQGAGVNKGIVNWMGSPNPTLDPRVAGSLLRLDELWVWDDEGDDWATFQIVGDKMLVFGKYFTANKLAWNPETRKVTPALKGEHPFREFCPNPVDGYYWGRSEVVNTMLLQYALNRRIDGINHLLRKQEDPPKKVTGGTGVNQAAISRFNKPGGWWSDSAPGAKLEEQIPTITADLWNDEHEIERMFDEMGGLPPVARGRGEAGVRGAGHAETLIRMATPRLKDSALLIERGVEGLGSLHLDLCRAHVGPDKKLIAWVPPGAAGIEAPSEIDPYIVAPVPGTVPVKFTFADLPEETSITVDSHSSSPAFTQDARALVFDAFKTGVFGPEDLVDHLDIPSPEQIRASIQRREVAKQQQIAELQKSDPQAALKLLEGGKKK